MKKKKITGLKINRTEIQHASENNNPNHYERKN